MKLKKTNRKDLAKGFEEWFVQASWDHIDAGWSLRSFSGKYPVSDKVWRDLISTHPRLQDVRNAYLMKLPSNRRGPDFMKVKK